MNPLNAKKLSYLRVEAFILRSAGLSVKEIAKKLEKSERWAVIPKKAKKAKYKRGTSTRQLSQQLASKGLVQKNTVWRFMKSEGWRPLRRQKKPLLTAKQRAARLKFAKQYNNLTTEEWDDFLFSDECPEYFFSCLISKMKLFGGLIRAKYLLHTR